MASEDWFERLNDREVKVLRWAAQGKDLKEIAALLGQSEKTIRNELSDSTYKKMGVPNLTAAAAHYANRLGLRSELLGNSSKHQRERYVRGRLRFDVCLVSHLRSPRDVRCVLAESPFEWFPVRTEMQREIAKRQKQIERKARARAEISYNIPGNILVVHRLNPENEFYTPIEITLQRTDYYIFRAYCDSLPIDWDQAYRFNPTHVVSPRLPIPLGVAIHLVVDEPPQLVLTKRATNLAGGGGLYAPASAGYGEASKDLAMRDGRLHFDFLEAMQRELREERGIVIADFPNRLDMLSLEFCYHAPNPGYTLYGYIYDQSIKNKDIVDARPRARESSEIDFLPLPIDRADSKGLRRVCEHLLTQPWVNSAAVSLVELLDRWYDSCKVDEYLRDS